MPTSRKPPSPRKPIEFVPPQLATLVDTAPEGDDWLHEVKFDGFRILCRIEDGVATLFTRTGQDWTPRFGPVAAAAGALGVDGALIDGEVAVLRPDGTTSFQALQGHTQGRGESNLAYFAFDLLFNDGEDIRSRPLEERKRVLEELLAGGHGGIIRYSDHVVGNGGAFFGKAAAAGLEGIICKRRGEPYHAGRGSSWLKVKAIKRQEFVVGGFTEPEGARTGLGALLVGFFRDQALIYAGKVGTGFSRTVAGTLRARLDKLIVDGSPFDSAVVGAGRQIRWVRPQLVVEVSFTEMTADGKLRHPSFQGLRDDKNARDVVHEVPTRADRPANPVE